MIKSYGRGVTPFIFPLSLFSSEMADTISEGGLKVTSPHPPSQRLAVGGKGKRLEELKVRVSAADGGGQSVEKGEDKERSRKGVFPWVDPPCHLQSHDPAP